MVDNVEQFIAARYLLSKRSVRFINVIGIVSICGIAIGVAALIIALSVFNGFSGVVTSVLVGFDPHLRIEQRGGFSQEEYRNIEHIVERTEHVRAQSPFIAGKVMIIVQSLNRVVILRGVDEQKIGEVSGVRDNIVLGKLMLSDSGDMGRIIIGMTLADRLGAVVGDDIGVILHTEFSLR